ncbi:MAG: DNA polymerase/3'-5' exonuclease PolX, partial [Proteobacteria bacterium]|nr:DNA polymerase/3'-5' exonuclease PolX [Pseudomonadota bacterium]
MQKNKQDVIELLDEMASLLQFEGANPFKIRAFENAVRALETFSDDFDDLVKNKKLQTIPGIGKGISADIEEFYQTGTVKARDEIKQKYPETLFELLKVPNLGPKKVKALFEQLDIKSLGELEYACMENRLVQLPGFGEKTQKKILDGIQFLKKNKGLYLYADVIGQVQELVDHMRTWKEIDQISIAGSLRRGKEVVHDADVVCSSASPEKVMDHFTKNKFVGTVTSKGDTKSSVVLKTGFPVDLRVVAPEEFPYALHHFTGSKEHNTWMRGLAKEKDLKMNEYGLWRDEKIVPCKSEEDIFKALGLSYVPPELREAMIEVKQKKMPELVELNDIKGFFHMHTTLSDGENTLEEMVQKAIDLGYEYIGLSDHSKTAYYANGLKEADILKQHEEVDRIQKKYKQIRIFKGIESDILADGSLDYPDKVLKKFDFVIASIHGQFNFPEEVMTERCVRALQNPYTTMLGHPTGRLLLGREGFKLNLNKVIDTAADHGKVLELNSHPHRLDLDWRVLPQVKSKKVMVSVNPDAHSVRGIEDIQYGILIARKGGLEKQNVLNTLSATQIEK